MASTMAPSPLANSLATPAHLQTSSSSLDAIPASLESSIRYAGARLTQAAGILLRLPQEVIAQAIVVYMRFWLGPEGGSMVEYGAEDVSAASLYLSAKVSAWPKSARSIVNVYSALEKLGGGYGDAMQGKDVKAEDVYVTEGEFERRKTRLFETEQRILRTLGFNIHVVLPYTLCITYLQALDSFAHPRAKELAKRAIALLNTALLSPQCLFLTHQPPALATAAIYLAARETGIKMPECEWWEVFDTDREELGFLCVGFLSAEGFLKEESERWEGRGRRVPMSAREVAEECRWRKEHEESEG